MRANPIPGFARDDPYRRYWLGETATVLAYQMLAIAIGWQVYDLTNSALSLGLIGLAQFLPQFLLALVAGHVADRYDRRRVVLLCQTLKFGIALALAAGSYTGKLTGELMYLASFLIGIASAFQSPSLRSMLPTLVPRTLLPRCLAWSGAVRKVAVVTGPALGGALYLAGPGIVYVVGALAFVVAGTLLGKVDVPFVERSRQPVTLETLFGGIAHIRSSPVLLGAMSLDLFAVLLGGATALLPVYARDILHTGPAGLGLLRAAPAVGALLASVYLVKAPLATRVGRVMYGCVAVFGICMVIFGLSESFALSLVILIISGAADMVSVVIRSSLVQLDTPDEKRGRVTAVSSLFNSTANQLGQFESGVVAAWLGAVPSVVLGGVGTVVIVGLWMRWFPALLQREALVRPAQH
jgi:MFS family permease